MSGQVIPQDNKINYIQTNQNNTIMKAILLSAMSLALFFMTATSGAAQTTVSGSLPKKMEVKLDFTQHWPFNEPVKSEARQNQKGGKYLGDTYTYTHKGVSANGAEEYQVNLPFFFRANAKPHVYARARYFDPGSKNCRMTIPAVEGMRLESVILETRNGSEYPKGFKIKNEDFTDLAECLSPSYKGSPAVVKFPTPEGSDTKKGTSYFMSFTDANTHITSITLVYTK